MDDKRLVSKGEGERNRREGVKEEGETYYGSCSVVGVVERIVEFTQSGIAYVLYITSPTNRGVVVWMRL